MIYACPRCKEPGIDPAKAAQVRCSRCSGFSACHVCQRCAFTICETCIRKGPQDPKKTKFIGGIGDEETEV